MLAIGGDAVQVAGRLCDLSHAGAAIEVAGCKAAAGDSGGLTLDRHGGVQARFDVRAVDGNGRMHVQFAKMEPAFQRAVETLLAPAVAPRVATR